MAKGKVVQVIGTVVDVEFPPDQLPALFNAIEIPTCQTGRSCWKLKPICAITGSAAFLFRLPKAWSAALKLSIPGRP